MSNIDCETVAWVDPYVLGKAAATIFDDDDDVHQEAKRKLQRMVQERQLRSLPRGPDGSVSFQKPQRFLHPVEFSAASNAGTANRGSAPQQTHTCFTHVAVGNGTFVATTKNLFIHFFDQTNDIPISSFSLLGQSLSTEKSSPAAVVKLASAVSAIVPGSAPGAPQPFTIDARDTVVRLFLDPMGRHAVVVFQSGAQLLFHIKRSTEADTHEADDKDQTDAKKKKKKQMAERPSRYDIQFAQDVSRVPQFTIESIGWDEQNPYETTTGDVILGSQRNGSLVACRFESTGVVAARHLFTFPAPFHRSPIHSVATLRETDGKKRTAVLVAMENKLFFFRSTRSNLESAFVVAELQAIPETELELQFLASSGNSALQPLKNFWAVSSSSNIVTMSPIGTTSTSTPISSQAASCPTSGPGLAVSSVTIHHHPVTTRAESKGPSNSFPTTFTWSYFDTIVQGVLLPFADPDCDGEETNKKPGSVSADVSVSSTVFHSFKSKDRKSQKGSNAEGSLSDPNSPDNILSVMQRSVRFTTVENVSCLLAACEQALQYDVTSQATSFSAAAMRLMPGPNSTLQERILRVSATYFYLIVATQTKLYVFTHTALLPFPTTSQIWDIRSRLMLHWPLTYNAEAPTPVIIPPGQPYPPPTKLGTASQWIYRPDLGSCLQVGCDPKQPFKLYVGGWRDIFELALPQLKRQFAIMFTRVALSVANVPASTPATLERSNSSAVLVKLRPLPPVSDSKGPTSSSPLRFRSTTTVATRKKAPEAAQAAAYPNLSMMRLFSASRFPLVAQLRLHGVTSDAMFEMAIRLVSGRNGDLDALHLVSNAFGESLFQQRRYFEAAVRQGKYCRKGVDTWFARFADLRDMGPLLLFVLTRIQVYDDAGKSLIGGKELACLSTAALFLILHRCNHPDSQSCGEVSPTNCQTMQKSPRLLLEELIAKSKDLLPWSVVRQCLFRIAPESEVTYVCREMDQLKELLGYFLAHGRHFDALTLVIERSQKEFNESLCYDEEGYVHPGVAANLWVSFAGEFLRHFPVRMILKGWMPYGSEIGLDPIRLLPSLAKYALENNETIFESQADPDSVSKWLASKGSEGHAAAINFVAPMPSELQRCQEHVGITYLRHLTGEGYAESSISNLLLLFLAQSGSDDDLVQFVTTDKTVDMQYALRVCLQHQRIPAIVTAYFRLGHLHQAVDMALAHKDVTRAKKLVEMVRDGTVGAGDFPAATRRELWRKIVAHVAEQQFGPKNALHLISESHNDVDVSHVIPHLSDDVMLSEFKNELLENVADFGRLMRGVREDIAKAKCDVEFLRGDVEVAERTSVRIDASKRCDQCGASVWVSTKGEPVVFRGCTHTFHDKCLRERWECIDRQRGKASNSSSCVLCSPDALGALLREPLSSETSFPLTL